MGLGRVGRPPSTTDAACGAMFDVLMRRRQLTGGEDLAAVRARVDAAESAEQLRAALLEEGAVCVKRMELLEAFGERGEAGAVPDRLLDALAGRG